MDRRKWLAVLLVCLMLPGMLLGCGKNEPENTQPQLPQPPSVSREGWQGYPVAGLTVYLPEMFEEGRVFEENGEFLSWDEDFDGDYVQLQVISGLEDELETEVTDAQMLTQHFQKQVEENDGVIYAAGTYWDVPYLIYSEFGAEQAYTVVGLYAWDGRGWMVEITGMHPDRAVQMVPYACSGVVQSPAGWDADKDRWMTFSIAGMGVRIPAELLEEADFYADCAYFADSQSDTELEVMSGLLEEFEGAVTDAQTLAVWFAGDQEADGDTVLTRDEANGVPYLVCWEGEDAILVGFYVSGEQYWMVAAENVATEPETGWIDLVTGGQIG